MVTEVNLFEQKVTKSNFSSSQLCKKLKDTHELVKFWFLHPFTAKIHSEINLGKFIDEYLLFRKFFIISE